MTRSIYKNFISISLFTIQQKSEKIGGDLCFTWTKKKKIWWRSGFISSFPFLKLQTYISQLDLKILVSVYD